MTLRDHNGGADYELPNMTLLVADALREAADDGGISLAGLEAKVGTRWALRHICTLNRSGFTIGEDDGRYLLVHDPEAPTRDGMKPPDTHGMEPGAGMAA